MQPQPPQPRQAPPPRQSGAPGPSVTEYRLDGHTISDLSRGSRGELIPISPSTEVGGLGIGTPPSVLKRQKKRRVALSPVTENSANLSFLDSCNSLTPKSTPVKTLPFSPSQVCGPAPTTHWALCAGSQGPGPGRARRRSWVVCCVRGLEGRGALRKLAFWPEDQSVKKPQVNVVNEVKEKANGASSLGGGCHPGGLPRRGGIA